METLADSKLRAMCLARGRVGTERERGLREREEHLPITTKAQSSCLLGRLARLGEGPRAAAKRREWVRKEAMKAHWVANWRGSEEGGGNLCLTSDSPNQGQSQPVTFPTTDSPNQCQF
jgi:hypothetical protein